MQKQHSSNLYILLKFKKKYFEHVTEKMKTRDI